MKRCLIAVVGGIGSGKSVVCEILRTIGYEVYDSDSRAKALMDCDDSIKRRISEEISSRAVGNDGVINRKMLSEIVFSDPEKLELLNRIVHSAVRADLRRWAANREIAFVETAILYQSGLDAYVDHVWFVDAPKEIRIERVMKRNSMSAEEVERRICAQDSFTPTCLHPNTETLVNDGFIALLPQVEQLLLRL